jgi:hypothetical protein
MTPAPSQPPLAVPSEDYLRHVAQCFAAAIIHLLIQRHFSNPQPSRGCRHAKKEA